MSRSQVTGSRTHLFGLVVILIAVGFLAQACGTGNSPTEPTDAGGNQNPSGSNGGSNPGLGIDLEKFTNGEDADEEPGPEILVGERVTWTYVVTNTGQSALTHIALKDRPLGDIDCPSHNLTPGESMTCKARGEAVEGQYHNRGTVTGNTPDSRQVTDEDDSHYIGISPDEPRIDLEKFTNGEDADEVPGPEILVGDPVTWTYLVKNTGRVNLANITLVDVPVGPIRCPLTTLEPGESMRCTATDEDAEVGQYTNRGEVTGTGPDGRQTASDVDHSHYLGIDPDEPSIDLEKYTNGEDADRPTGPRILVGDLVTWTYSVVNTGEVPLAAIALTDDQLGPVECPSAKLQPGKAMRCTATGFAELGQYRNVGAVVGFGPGPDHRETVDTDPSHYFGFEDDIGDIGCSHGYWKNHASSWLATGYSQQDTVGRVFVGTIPWPDIAASSLSEALDFGGGSGIEGAVKNLMRQAVAALLNAAHPDVRYPRTAAEVINLVDRALASNDRQDILTAKDLLDEDNNLGCPLD